MTHLGRATAIDDTSTYYGLGSKGSLLIIPVPVHKRTNFTVAIKILDKARIKEKVLR